MVSVYNQQEFGKHLSEGIRSIEERKKVSLAAIHDELCGLMGIGKATLYSWMSGNSTPKNIDGRVLMKFIWKVLVDGSDGRRWVEDLFRDTDIPIPEPMSMDWMREYMRKMGLTAEQIAQVQDRPDGETTTTLWEDARKDSLKNSHVLQAIKPLGDDCIFPIKWAGPTPDQFELDYTHNKPDAYYHKIPGEVEVMVERWRSEHRNDFQSLSTVPWGSMVRLDSIEPSSGYADGSSRIRLNLSPMKFLYYRAIHARLSESPLSRLRTHVFENAVIGLSRRERLLLPSHFAAHIAVIGTDHKVLLQQRHYASALFPNAWDAGIGHFMHGPQGEGLAHFKEDKADLGLFLRQAVRQELDYDPAQDADFKIYGVAIEKESLAPKLLVIYRADVPVHNLIQKSTNRASQVADYGVINLSPSDLVKAMTGATQFATWTPCSRLALMLALRQDSPDEQEGKARIEEVKNLLERQLSGL